MCNRPIRELEVQFEKIHFTPDPAQHISRCPPALAAPRPCHPPRCQQPPSAAARSPLHSRQGCTWTVIVSILSGSLPFCSPAPSAPPSPCRPSPSPCQPAPGPTATFILFHSRIWNGTLSSSVNTIPCTVVNRSGTHLTNGVRQCTWNLAGYTRYF